MKVVATIFQCKRVSMPYFFIKYCVPKMKELSGFDFEIYLIQHTTPVEHFCLASTSLNGENVKKFTDEGKFDGAHIIQHSTNNKECPPYPSYKIGVETALKEKADLHIWLEDDALIFDKNIKRWTEIEDVGTYSEWRFIPVRHTITTRSFDERMLNKLNTEKWNAGAWNNGPVFGHPEYFMTECCKKRLYLSDQHITFYHESEGWHIPVRMDFLRRFVPESELKYLDLDFKQKEQQK
jgi:hypothetical protein